MAYLADVMQSAQFAKIKVEAEVLSEEPASAILSFAGKGGDLLW